MEKEDFSTNYSGGVVQPHSKEKSWLYPPSVKQKFYFEQILYLNIKTKTIKILQESRGDNHYNIGLTKDFWNKI